MTLHFVFFFFLNIPERSVLRLPETLPIGINKVFFNGLYFIYITNHLQTSTVMRDTIFKDKISKIGYSDIS